MGIENLFDRKVGVYRIARSPDGQGGWTETFALVQFSPARVRPLSEREKTVGGYVVGETVLRIYTPATVDVRSGDRMAVSGVEGDYRVVGNPRDPHLQGHHLECDVQEVH